MKIKTNQKGFSLIEVLLAMAIFSVFTVGVLYLSLDTVQRDSKISINNEALLYAQEGLEAARNIADINYINLANGDHGLNLAAGAWGFIAAPESIDTIYERTLTVDDVYRNVDGDIAADGIFYDPDTKMVTSEVIWYQNAIIPKTITLSTYISNWKGDDWIQTTCDEFNNGTFINTSSNAIAGPPADNCEIVLAEIAESGDFFATVNVGKHGNDVDVDGNYAYLAVSDEGEGFSIIDITDPEIPTIASSLNVNKKGRYIYKNGSNVYIGIGSGNKGLAVVDVTNPVSPSLIATKDIDGYGNQPAKSGNYLYMAVDEDHDSFIVFDVSTPSNPTQVDSIDFDDEVQVIKINGNYAYVGLDDDQQGFRIVDISNPLSVSQVATLDLDEEVNAISITGSVAFVGTEDSSNSLYAVDISNPAAPSVITSIDIGGEIQDLTISGDFLYAAVDDQGLGLAAINISNPNAPTLSYTLDIQGKGTGIDSNADNVFISTDTSNKGLVIIGTTVSGAEVTGEYESQVFDTSSADARYNFIEWSHTIVPGGTVSLQLRTASSLANLSGATWVGSDGTAGTYYTSSRTSIVEDPLSTGSQYCQYKLFITSDGVSTPMIESIRINYTP